MERQPGQGPSQKRDLPNVGVVDVKGQTDNSKNNAQAGENRDGDEEFLRQEAEGLDDQGLVSWGRPSCMAHGRRGKTKKAGQWREGRIAERSERKLLGGTQCS